MPINPGARGLIYHAKMVDLIRFLAMVKSYAEYQPPPAAVESREQATEAASAETTSDASPVASEPATASAASAQASALLLVLLLDRSLESTPEPPQKGAWERLQEGE